MTERSVGKVKWRARSLERGKEKKRRRDKVSERRAEEGKEEVKECNRG